MESRNGGRGEWKVGTGEEKGSKERGREKSREIGREKRRARGRDIGRERKREKRI